MFYFISLFDFYDHSNRMADGLFVEQMNEEKRKWNVCGNKKDKFIVERK